MPVVLFITNFLILLLLLSVTYKSSLKSEAIAFILLNLASVAGFAFRVPEAAAPAIIVP